MTDNVDKGKINIEYCPTDEMVGDFFTKPLQGSKFVKFRSIILGTHVEHPTMADQAADPVRKECIGGYGSKLDELYDKSKAATPWIEVKKKTKKKGMNRRCRS